MFKMDKDKANEIAMLIGIIVSTVTGAASYIGLMSLLKIDEFKTVISMIFGRFISNKKLFKV